MRSKLCRWKLQGVERKLEQRCLKIFRILHYWVAPRVVAAYFRALWNGWPTDRCMQNMRCQAGHKNRGCVLKCGWDEDSLEHYSTCSVFWRFASAAYPQGLGIPSYMRSREAFFLVHETMSDMMVVRMALGIYSLQRTIMHCRSTDSSIDHMTLLRLWMRRAANGSKATFKDADG